MCPIRVLYLNKHFLKFTIDAALNEWNAAAKHTISKTEIIESKIQYIRQCPEIFSCVWCRTTSVYIAAQSQSLMQNNWRHTILQTMLLICSA
jgi:hypothetical protein